MTQFKTFFSELRDPLFLDWSSVTGGSVPFTSFVDTWYGMSDDAALWMEAPWVVTFLSSDSNTNGGASCFMTPRWDWTEDGFHKSGPPSQCAIARTGSVEDFRHRVRGKGRALQLHFASNGQVPMNLLGWSIQLDRNANY